MTPQTSSASCSRRKRTAGRSICTTTKDVPDGMVGVSHKAGQVEHLFVTETARGKGIRRKMLDFARKKLPEHAHPVLRVLNTNTRAIALYSRMGWRLTGSVLHRK